MSKPLKNVAASVRQKLANLSKESNRPFAELLQYYGMERFLYRLSQSKYRDGFVLKGALMFVVWKTPRSRTTRDIDFLAKIDNSVGSLTAMVKNVFQTKVEDDGLGFYENSVEGEVIKENADYSGVRVTFTVTLDRARIPMQLDVGFGDAVTPASAEITYPPLLDLPAPRLQGYPMETVIAEKFEAAVKLDTANTRMKDFYDLWLLSRQFDFDGATLSKAIQATFARRGTVLTADPTAFTSDFYEDTQKQAQWRAFVARTRLDGAPDTLRGAVQPIRDFLGPVAQAGAADRKFTMRWKAPGPWRPK